MARASIDIGSNSLLLLVVDDDGAPVYDQVSVVGLGKGIGHRGMFAADRMEAALSIAVAKMVPSSPQLRT